MSERKLKMLAEFEEKHRKNAQKIDNIWKLIKSIHSSPVLREWVTLESEPLCPFVIRNSETQETIVHLLLAIPGTIKGNNVILPPWGYVAWQWPSRRLISMMDIRDTIEPFDDHLNSDLICTKEFADNIQKALDTDAELPLPPEPIQTIFKMFSGKSPIGKMESKKLIDYKERSITTSTSDNEEHDTSYCSEVFHYMKQANELITECKHESLLEEWRRIYARMNKPHFSIAVVGEFSRGKSTLINRLLNSDVLPIGVTPTTAMVTRVLYGAESKMWRMYPDGKKEQLPLNSESWKNLTADDSGTDPEGIIRIEIPNRWLKQTGVHIIDTPGAGDLIGRRAALTTDAIASCDATLIAISATTPLSLTERAFVEEHILSRKIPRVAIVLTRLDQLPEAERASVVTYINEKVADWAPEVCMCSAHGTPILPDDSIATCAGPDSILNMVSSWAGDEQHALLRSIQIKTQLKDIITVLRAALVTEKDAANLSYEERQETLKTGEQQLERNRLDWEDLQLELRKRENDCILWLERIVLEKKEDIVEKFRYELRHAPNPKQWWEEDLPYRLRQEMANVARGLERSLQNKIGSDLSWLEEEARNIFSVEMKLGHTDSLVKINELKGELGSEEMSDLNSIRLRSRIGLGAASILGYLIFGPFGIAASIGGGIISEKIFSKNIENQRKALSKNLDDVVDQILHDAVEMVQKRLQNVYITIFKGVQKQESIWFSARRESLIKDASSSNDDLGKVERQIKEVDELISKLTVSQGAIL